MCECAGGIGVRPPLRGAFAESPYGRCGFPAALRCTAAPASPQGRTVPVPLFGSPSLFLGASGLSRTCKYNLHT